MTDRYEERRQAMERARPQQPARLERVPDDMTIACFERRHEFCGGIVRHGNSAQHPACTCLCHTRGEESR